MKLNNELDYSNPYPCADMCCAGRPLMAVVKDFGNIESHRKNGGSHTPNFNRFVVFRVLAIFERPWKKKVEKIKVQVLVP